MQAVHEEKHLNELVLFLIPFPLLAFLCLGTVSSVLHEIPFAYFIFFIFFILYFMLFMLFMLLILFYLFYFYISGIKALRDQSSP